MAVIHHSAICVRDIDAGIRFWCEGQVPESKDTPDGPTTSGFLLLSIMTDLSAALARLDALGLGGTPRRIAVSGIDMAVVVDPNGVQVELVDSGAVANLEKMTGRG